jgi:hypothetical protein
MAGLWAGPEAVSHCDKLSTGALLARFLGLAGFDDRLPWDPSKPQGLKQQREGASDRFRYARAVMVAHTAWPQHLLNFLPEPQVHGSLRPTLMAMRPGLGRGPGLDDIKICLGPLWRQ